MAHNLHPTIPSPTPETAPDAGVSRLGSIGTLIGAAAVGYGMHRGFNSELPVVGNFSEHAGGASEVAEVAVMSGALAVAGLHRHIGRGINGIRRYSGSRKLDKLEEAIPTQEAVVQDVVGTVKAVRTGRSVADPEDGWGELPKGHHRRSRKVVNAHDKAHALEYEVQGLERFIGQPLGAYYERDGAGNLTPTAEVPTVTVTERDGFTRQVQISVSDIGTDIQRRRVASIPRTKEELDMYARTAHTHRHERHKARDKETKPELTMYAKEKKKLTTLSETADIVADRLDERGGYIPPLEEHDTRLGRTYASAKRAKRIARYHAEGVARPFQWLWHYFRD